MARKIKSVVCRSGLTGWQSTLHDAYTNFEEWLAYAEMYGLHHKFGYDTAEEAWDENPTIQGSVIPSDGCKVVNGKRCFFSCIDGEPIEEDEVE